ncbi:MAG: histidine kinase [Thiobacillus sp. SCN 63-1177]|nr:MAG: histidine kinase [Thiobacillus sp. SCN 63-1177]
MAIGEICNREVVFVPQQTPVDEAARLMRQHHVGDVVVVVDEEGRRKPIGIVTDRDVVVEVVAAGLDPAVLNVEEIMAPDLATVPEKTGVFEAIRYMRDKGVRRMPVVGEDGALIGILALDDLLELLAEELGAIARLITHEQDKEIRTRN